MAPVSEANEDRRFGTARTMTGEVLPDEAGIDWELCNIFLA
jgi:hypothetical protein